MNLSYYTAAVSASQQQKRLDVLSNNLANTSTPGFKSENVSFSALMNTELDAIDGQTVPQGSGARITQATTDFSVGSMMATGRAQDYAIQGDGFFALQDAATGEVSYTRDGSFILTRYQKTAEDGTAGGVNYLTDGDGRLVLNEEGATIEVTDASARQPVGVFDFINKEGMLHTGDNRFVPVEQNGQVRMGTGTAVQGQRESSNTDFVSSIAQMMEAQRSFGYALKMVQTTDEVESIVNSLRG